MHDSHPARYITVAAAAALLGISPQSYYRGVESGELPGLRIGHRITVSVNKLERLVGELKGAVTVEEAAGILGVSPNHYRRGVRRGELPCRRIAGRTVVLLADLDALDQTNGAA